jgi:8-oxo-dGTP pyrophosphatase MutT (NUDIX family)
MGSSLGYVAKIDRAPPGEELNTGAVKPARLAATAILVRDGADGLEVLLVQRNPEQRFMGGAWVFPGGAVHAEEDGGDPAAAALRELEEEAGIDLDDVQALVPFSRWITPEEVSIRFDTFFYVAAAPPGAEPRIDGAECVDARWIRPADALAAGERGELMLVFPTIKHLEQLAGLESVEHALAAARERDVRPVLPKVVHGDGEAHVLLPGEPGYPD